MERDPDVRQTCKKEARPAERLDSPSPPCHRVQGSPAAWQPGPTPAADQRSQQSACAAGTGAVLPACAPSKRGATAGAVPRSCLQQGSPPCQGMRDPRSEGFACQGGSNSLQMLRKGSGLPAETYPNRLGSIFLQGTVSQLQSVFSADTCGQEVHRQAQRSRTGRQGAWMPAWECLEPSQRAGSAQSGSNLGMVRKRRQLLSG